jgi:hypothetical protein
MKEVIPKLLIIGLLVAAFTSWIFLDLYQTAQSSYHKVNGHLTESNVPKG